MNYWTHVRLIYNNIFSHTCSLQQRTIWYQINLYQLNPKKITYNKIVMIISNFNFNNSQFILDDINHQPHSSNIRSQKLLLVLVYLPASVCPSALRPSVCLFLSFSLSCIMSAITACNRARHCHMITIHIPRTISVTFH